MKRIVRLTGLFFFMGITAASAQTGFFEVRVENVAPAFTFPGSGAFTTPVGMTDPAAIGPGGAYEFTFDAGPGMNLTIATMFVQSNDLFYAPGEEGIALWDEAGNPVEGDVTDQLMLWDAGTEVNEEPGEGANQAPRQSGPNTGEDEGGVVRLVDDGFTYPATNEVIQLTLTYLGDTQFMARIENVSMEGTITTSTGQMLSVPLAPGVWVVHTTPSPLFTDGAPDSGAGLEAVAEDGDPGALAAALAEDTGITHIFAPGVWAAHMDPAPLFTDGAPDGGAGLEALAEDGDPGALAHALALDPMATGAAFLVPDGAAAPGPLTPGGAYTFTVAAMPGSSLSLATMFVQSNDLFVAPGEMGIPLWDDAGNPIDGDVTDQLILWDAGTEVNEKPGFGKYQAPRQPGANSGMDEGGVVRMVDDGFTYPAVSEVLRVTVTPLPTTPFTVRVENVSEEGTLVTSTGQMLAVPLAPGPWVVHAGNAPLFTDGEPDRGDGLEAVAEDGDPGALADWLAGKVGYASGAFTTPVGMTDPAAIGPGGAYEFTIEAAPGTSLSLATMFVQSNDLFYAPSETGIPLWDDAGNPIAGDVTDQLMLWDAGTEANEEPGEGANQAPRQSGPNTGEDEGGVVRLVDDGFTYPPTDAVIRVTVTAVVTGVEDAETEALPDRFELRQNYPNPFNPETVIPFELREPGFVSLSVYNALGQKVADLAQGARAAGTYAVTWQGRDQSGQSVATGVYFYRLEVNGASVTRQMVLLR